MLILTALSSTAPYSLRPTADSTLTNLLLLSTCRCLVTHYCTLRAYSLLFTLRAYSLLFTLRAYSLLQTKARD